MFCSSSFLFLFVIGMLRFSIFFCDSLLISYIAMFINSFIHLFSVCVCVCAFCVPIVTHVKAWMWRPKFKAGCLPLITFLLFWRQHLSLSPEFTDLGRLTWQWDLVNHLCPPLPCWGYYRVCTTVPGFLSGLSASKLRFSCMSGEHFYWLCHISSLKLHFSMCLPISS